MFEKLSQYVLRGPKQAIFVAMLASFLPLLGWVSIIVVALVTLRKGAKDGFLVMLWSALPAVVFLYSGSTMPLIYGVLFGSLLVWLLAVILRHTINWALTVECVALLGALAVVAAHFFVRDIQAWWISQIMTAFSNIAQVAQVNLKAEETKEAVAWLAQYATGFQAAFITFSAIIELMIARALQAKLFNPGGFQQEFAQLRLNYLSVIVLAVCLVLAGLGQPVFKDILPVVLLPFMLAGVCFVHGMFVMRKLPTYFLVLFYLLLIFSVAIFPLFLGIVGLLTAAAIGNCFFGLSKS